MLGDAIHGDGGYHTPPGAVLGGFDLYAYSPSFLDLSTTVTSMFLLFHTLFSL